MRNAQIIQMSACQQVREMLDMYSFPGDDTCSTWLSRLT